MKELPLILFGVLSQAAVGLVLVTLLLPAVLGTEKTTALQGALRNSGRLVFPLAALAVLASFFHLGTPLGGYRALNHVGTSWMSNEVLLAAIFTALAAVLFFFWHQRPAAQGAIRGTSAAAAVVGVALVYATGMIYQLPTRPAWNHWTNLLSGFVTALLLGALLMALLALWSAAAEVPSRSLVWLGGVALGAVALLMVSLVIYGPYLMGVSATTAAAVFGSGLFWARLALGIGLPVYVAAQLVRGQQPGRAVLGFALLAALAGEMVARGLFYNSVLDQIPFF